jgi:hypothetical protein
MPFTWLEGLQIYVVKINEKNTHILDRNASGVQVGDVEQVMV